MVEKLLQTLALSDRRIDCNPVSYWYAGKCPRTHRAHQLPRTAEAEAIAHTLMRQLATDPLYQREGKMYGVLLVETAEGDRGVLKAFSGQLSGQSSVAGWVPPIPGRAQVALTEANTLKQLDDLKTRIIALKQLPERTQYEQREQSYADQLQALSKQHRQRKQARDRQRQVFQTELAGAELETQLERLVHQSQHDGMERRRLKRERDQALTPLQAAIAAADAQIRDLKRQRKSISQQLQAQMHAVYSLTNFSGETLSLHTLSSHGLPTGTGDCAAPKLLHYAAVHGFRPLAMAEFWWGPASGDKQPGRFYGACVERCQPIMGFLLSGLSPTAIAPSPISDKISVLHEDEALLIVDKPSGLLSVPGRTIDLQDSVLSRLRCQRTDLPYLKTAHRLDKGTSGVLILAKMPDIHRALGQQFALQQVRKIYEAILSQPVSQQTGTIDLPLVPDSSDRPKQKVDWQHGKSCLTTFQVLVSGQTPRLRLFPHTGRTHQLRVHAAHPQGLNSPIRGDVLYGKGKEERDRLCLHAKSIQFTHPQTQSILKIASPLPF